MARKSQGPRQPKIDATWFTRLYLRLAGLAQSGNVEAKNPFATLKNVWQKKVDELTIAARRGGAGTFVIDDAKCVVKINAIRKALATGTRYVGDELCPVKIADDGESVTEYFDKASKTWMPVGDKVVVEAEYPELTGTPELAASERNPFVDDSSDVDLSDSLL